MIISIVLTIVVDNVRRGHALQNELGESVIEQKQGEGQ